jgi:hypothetical protein
LHERLSSADYTPTLLDICCAARVQRILDWIEGDGDRVTLALAEMNFFCLLGFLLLLNAFVGFVAVIVTKPSRPFGPILEALTFIPIGSQSLKRMSLIAE